MFLAPKQGNNDPFMLVSARQPITLPLRLRQAANATLNFVGNTGLLREAADAIEELQMRVRSLEQQKSPEGQRAIGYAEAQRDIRRALGVDE